MATNFLDQALNLLGLKSPDDTDYYDPSVYRAEVNITEAPKPHKPTKVELYQQKQNSSSTGTKELSGVAKYLAEKQQPAQEINIQEAETTAENLTGVAKYLASRQQEEQITYEGMTSVEKYLFNLKTGNKQPLHIKTPTVEKETPEILSRVDMYLAKKQGLKLEPKVKPINKDNLNEKQAVAPKAKTKDKATTSTKQAKITQTTDNITTELIDLSKAATQCQAETVKRTQCSRNTSLETIEQSINEKHYKFAVCNQHNKDAFIPFAQILQDT